jgi:hypothetical protein
MILYGDRPISPQPVKPRAFKSPKICCPEDSQRQDNDVQGDKGEWEGYLTAVAANFLTMASNSLRSLSLRLVE